MKKYLLILAAILLLWGCIAEDRTECTNPRGVFVSLTVRPERMSSVTRSADETAIRDLNLYLYDDNGNVVLHRYQTSATLRFECLPGDYRMCIAANLGAIWATICCGRILPLHTPTSTMYCLWPMRAI